MTTETTINTLIDNAQLHATAIMGAASNLLADAVDTMNQYAPRYPNTVKDFTATEYGYGSSGAVGPSLQTPTFPTIRQPKAITKPSLGEVSDITATLTAEKPDIAVPDFSYQKPSELASFTDTLPIIDDSLIEPTAPTFDPVDKPTLLTINTDIESLDFQVPSLNTGRPTYTKRNLTEWNTAFSAGQSAMPDLITFAQSVIHALNPEIPAVCSNLTNRLNNHLSGQGALPDAFESAMVQRAARAAELALAQATQQLDDASSASGWDLPGKVSQAARIRMQTDFANTLSGAALDAYTKRSELEVGFIQTILQVSSQIQSLAAQLFSQAMGTALDIFKAAISFADSATQFSLRAYELAQKDYEIEVSILEQDIRVFEAQLKAQLAQVEVTRNKIELEKLKEDVNKDLIQEYVAQLKAQETQASLYAEQIAALEAKIKLRKIPLEIFAEKVSAFNAMAETKKLQYGLIQAQIEGDKAKVEGQLAKLKVYSTEAEVYQTEVSAQSKIADVQLGRNTQLLEQYKTEVQAELSLVQTDEAIARYAVDAFEAASKVFIAQVDEGLKKDQLDFDQKLESAKYNLEVMRWNFEKEFKAILQEFERLKAQSAVRMDAARVYGEMGQAASSTLNAVAALSTAEQL